MKNILKSWFVPVLALAVLPFMASCETDTDDNPTLKQPEVNSLAVKAPADMASTTYDLDNTAPIRFIATEPDYGTNLVVQYQVQMSVDPAFQQVSGADIPEDVLFQTLSTSYTKDTIDIDPDELNLAVARLYREVYGSDAFDTPIPVYLRFVAHVNGSNVGYVYSEVITVPNVVTYYVELGVDLYYLVGVGDDWNFTSGEMSEMTYIFYPQGSNNYSYTTKWEGGATFKFSLGDNWGNWNEAFAAPNNDDQSPSGVIKEKNGGGNFKCPTPGEFYTFTIDMDALTYTWTKCESQSPAEYQQMGISGGFNNWASDTFMEEVSPHNWYINVTFDTETQLKFRVDEDWNVGNWGGNGADNDVKIADQIYGTGKAGGGNILVPAGTYNIYFNDMTAEFVFVEVK